LRAKERNRKRNRKKQRKPGKRWTQKQKKSYFEAERNRILRKRSTEVVRKIKASV